MVIRKKCMIISLLAMTVFMWSSSVWAAYIAYIHDTCWDPPNVQVDSSHPYYFPLSLPGWDFEYTKATFELTYEDQCGLDIFVYAADPATDTSVAANYNILLGTVPIPTTPGASGTVAFDLFVDLTEDDFNALFQNQSILYVVSDCHYVFDKACLHLKAVPIPGSVLLLGSGLLGLIGLGRRRSR